MRIALLVSAMVAAQLVAPSQLRAAEVRAEHATVMIGLERVLGFTNSRVRGGLRVDDNFIQDRTEFGLPPSPAPQPYALPRFALDVRTPRGFTAGGGLGLYIGKARVWSTTTMDFPNPPVTFLTILAAPRLGYLWRINRVFGVWGRAGVTYLRTFSHQSFDDSAPGREQNGIQWDLAVDVEPTLLITAGDRLAISIGGLLDWPLSGGAELELVSTGQTISTRYPHSIRNFGLMAGALLRF